MSFTERLDDAFTTLRCTETVNSIPQFSIVAYDKANANGGVRTDNANAGGFAGVCVSTGITSTYVTSPNVQPNNPMRVRFLGVTPVRVASGVTINVGDTLYTNAALQGAVTNVATGATKVGMAREASAGGTADIITAMINCLP